jgi:hypothetical protein
MTSTHIQTSPLGAFMKFRRYVPIVLVLLIAMMTVRSSPHVAVAASVAPVHMVGGLSTLCGVAIGFGIVAAVALTTETAGFGAALGVSAAIHIAALAC